MQWPDSEKIVQVDGKDRNSILILRERLHIERRHFAHDYVSELLRAAVVGGVSALDGYMHEQVLSHSWSLLSRAEDKIPTELKKLEIPLLDVKRAIDHARKKNNTRPGNMIKKSIQEILHKNFTFQKPDNIKKAADMLGIADFWGQVASKMSSNPSKENVIDRLRQITYRRNQIVHEADLERKARAKKLTFRKINRNETQEIVTWITNFGKAMDTVISELDGSIQTS